MSAPPVCCEAHAVLREVEWRAAYRSWVRGGCFFCIGRYDTGHDPSCRLAAALSAPCVVSLMRERIAELEKLTDGAGLADSVDAGAMLISRAACHELRAILGKIK